MALPVVVPLGITLSLFGLTLEPTWLLVFGVMILVLLWQPIAPRCRCAHQHFSQKEDFARMRGGNNWYKVHEDLDQPQVAAETLDQLNSVATILIANLYAKYITDPQGLDRIKPDKRKRVRNGIISMRKNFRSTNLEENIPSRSGGDTSYVIDKGDIFAVCVRDPKHNDMIDTNQSTLTFVMIHELAHLFTPSYGHDTLFWNNFGFLLREAVEQKLYEPVDYAHAATPYCGIDVTYSPLFDKGLESYFAV